MTAAAPAPPRRSVDDRSTLIKPDLVYRPDVDGLRALAVVAVILFHAEFPMFSGGYVGVDVFFVISGYLITQRVVAGVEDGRFSFWEFYAKRVRRLLPAAATTTAATLGLGILLLPPAALRRLAQSVVAAAASVSNVWFWSQSGYWDAEATAKPLLHTWSLGVEEQFYLVWPLLIVGLVVWRQRSAIWPLLGIGLGSLLVTWWMTGVDPAAAFYLTPFRVYEFVAGAAIVWLDRLRWPEAGRVRLLRSALWLVGIVAVVAPVLMYDETTAFPGIAAAVPALGTATVIAVRRPSGLDRVLSNRPTTHIGLISYSLYLIHWPALVFARTITGDLTHSTVIVALLITLALSELQYRFVEHRFRWRRGSEERWSWPVFRRVSWPALSVSLAVLLAGCAVAVSGGIPSRYDGTIRDLATMTREGFTEDRAHIRQDLCGDDQPPLCGEIAPGDVNVLVVGDSHVPDGLNIVAAARPDVNLLMSAHGGCPPAFDLDEVTHSYPECDTFNEQRFQVIEELADDLDVVVISSRLDAGRVDPTAEVVEWIERDVGVDVIVLGQGPFYEERAQDIIVESGRLEAADQALTASTIIEIYDADRRLRAAVEDSGAVYVQKLAWMCPGRTCRAFVPGTTDLMVFDRHHLTRAAGEAFGRHSRQELDRAISGASGA